jgi:hypothetical protein
MDSTSHKTADDIINESDGSGSGSTISDATSVSNGKGGGQKLMVPLGEKNKETNKEDNKVCEFLLILIKNKLMTTW